MSCPTNFGFLPLTLCYVVKRNLSPVQASSWLNRTHRTHLHTEQTSAAKEREKPFESWVTWPMSEGIQGQKRKKEENATNISTPAQQEAEEAGKQPTRHTRRASRPKSGASRTSLRKFVPESQNSGAKFGYSFCQFYRKFSE